MTGLNAKNIGEVAHSVFDMNFFKAILLVLIYIFDYLFKTRENFLSIILPIILISTLDTVTGFYYAIKSRSVDSEKYSRILNKVFSFSVYILVAMIIDNEMGSLTIFGYVVIKGWAIASMKGLIISSESLSIFENLAKLGFPVPEKIRSYLKAFNDDGKEIKK